MPFDIVLPGHKILLDRIKNRAVVEGEDVAGDVGVGFGDGGDKDLVFCVDADDAFVKGPVAELAEAEAV